MCNQITINKITIKVVEAAKISLGDKLDKVILYGSCARGDYDNESDIDIMVLADIPAGNHNPIRRVIHSLLDYIDLEYDVVLSLNVNDSETFNKYCNDLPFYMNVVKDGMVLYDK